MDSGLVIVDGQLVGGQAVRPVKLTGRTHPSVSQYFGSNTFSVFCVHMHIVSGNGMFQPSRMMKIRKNLKERSFSSFNARILSIWMISISFSLKCLVSIRWGESPRWLYHPLCRS